MQHLQPSTTLQGGKYRIERVLGQGGFGNTYIATNTVFDDHVAIKEFFMQGVNDRDENSGSVTIGVESNTQQFDEQKEKFKKEARRLWKLKNEHIVKVHDLFEENGTAYYVMDYINGESLAERLKRTGKPMSEQDIKKLLPQILDALKEVHKNEMWHLDLKPGNIMVDKQGNAYLIDFGASKQIRANGSMTTSTALCYTPGYAPNEQIGQMYDRFGPWTDIYALGATIYNLLTNKKPPMGIDIEENGENAFDFPNSVSDDLRKLVVWMMQPKRKERPQGVEEIFLKLSATEIMKEKPQSEMNAEEAIVAGFVQDDDEETIISSKCTAKEFEKNARNTAMEEETISSNEIDKFYIPLNSERKRYKISSQKIEEVHDIILVKIYAGSIKSIVQETQVSKAIVLFMLGYILRELKYNNFFRKVWKCNGILRNGYAIDLNFVYLTSTDVYRLLRKANKGITVSKIRTELGLTIEATLIVIGWLYKDNKIRFLNNSVMLKSDE